MAINRSQSITATALSVSSGSAVFANAVTAGNAIVTVLGITRTGAGANLSTITDNINNAGFAGRILSTMTSDTGVQLFMHDKLNISSGAGASTYRVSFNFSASANYGFCALEYSGGPFTFGSTGSSNGTSTGPRGPTLTASSTPALFVSGAVHNSTSVFASTTAPAGNPYTHVTTVDPTNANQVVNVIQSTHSSLAQQLTHSMTSSTRWLAATVLYLGLGGAAPASLKRLWRMATLGVQ